MKYQEIKERASQIAAEPVKGLDKEKLEKVYTEFKEKTRKSALLAERIKGSISQGSQHTLPPSLPYPLFMDRGKGSIITDVDGNSYIDYILSGGAILLGHNCEYINGRILDLIKDKTNFHGFFDEMEIKTAEKIKEHLPSIEKLRFTSSGAEANMAALRMARSFTGKKKIIKFRGAYHGWADPFMTDMEIPGSGRYLS